MTDSNDPRLTAYVLGELDDAERAEVERQLEQSAELREEVEAIRQTTALLGDELQAEPCPALTDQQRSAIQQPAEEASVSLAARPRKSWSRRLAEFTTIAVVAVILLLLLQPATQYSHPSRRVASQNESVRDRSAEIDFLGGVSAKSETGRYDEAGSRLSEEAMNYRDLPPESLDAIRDLNTANTELSMPSAASDPVGGPSVSIGLDQDGAGDFDAELPVLDGFNGRTSREDREFSSSSRRSPDSYREPDMFGDAFGESDLEGMSETEPRFRGELRGGRGLPSDTSDLSVDSRGRVMAGDASESLSQNLQTINESTPPVNGKPEAGPARPNSRRQFLEDLREAGAGESDAPASESQRMSEDRRRSASTSASSQNEESSRVKDRAPGRVNINSVEGESVRSLITESVGANNRGTRSEKSEDAKNDGLEQDGRDLQELDEERPIARGNVEKKPRAKRTWRRANATPNASRLLIGDREELLLEGMQVNVLVDGFRARVLLDLYYFNNRGQQLEGNFKLRLPNEASLYYFAFGQSAFEYRPQVDQLAAKGFLNGELVRASGLSPKGILEAREGSWSNVKEARVVPREKAAHAYSETVRRRVDPALVEWSGAGVFNARVFPLMPNKLHRVVVGYDVNLQQIDGDLVYQLDLPKDVSQCMVDLNVSALPGTSAEIQPEARAFTSGGRAYYHFNEVSDREIELRFKGSDPVMLTGADSKAGEFFATRVTPDLPAGEMEAGAEQAVFLVDTSLSSRPDKYNVWLDLLEATLQKNRDSMKNFAVLFFNIESHWWKEGFVDNTPENVDELLTFCHSLSLEGATDLRQALLEANSPRWAAKDKAEAASSDLFLLSDGAVTWGEMNVHRLSEALAENESALFAYKTGMTGTATGLLEHLTRETGGAVFSVVSEEEVASAATAHRRRPWKLLDLTVPGGSDLLIAGRPEHIYPGQPLLVVGRGEPDTEVMLHVRRGDEDKHVSVPIDGVVDSELAPRLYGQVAVGQLEDLGNSLEDVSVAYARHFRVTGRTCSLLMLDSEADYQRFNIKPEDDVFVVRSTPSANLITKKLDELAEQLSDAKAAVVAWLDKLENTAGFQFNMPTALRLVIDRLPQEAFDVDAPTLACKVRERGGAAKQFVQQLDTGKLDYLTIATQARQRRDQQGPADGLKTLSSLIEQNPGDPVLTRDVAFSAIEWGLGGQAYSLLKRVALMRPYEPQSYQAMAQCLAEIGYADLAMVYYEVALNARWHERYKDVRQIAGVEYLRLLRRINQGDLSSHAPEYAQARLESLAGETPIENADLVIMMMWNTDRTDVDLHVVEPTGEECYYDHPKTRIGGSVTRDVTEGYGPEMYTLPSAKHGKYRIIANYFGSDRNRTQVRTKVYITVYEDFGGKRERISKKTITLSDQKEKRELTTVMVEK
jgi:anti-sigma-K factor RskA